MYRRFAEILVLLGAAACNQLVDVPDLERGPCDPFAGFVTLGPVGGLARELGVQNAWLSSDERTVVLSRITYDTTAEPPVPRYGDLYLAHRDRPGDDFGAARPFTELNSEFDEYYASMTSDLLTIYFDRLDRPMQYRILMATRVAPDAPFGPPVPVALGGDDVSSDFEPFVAEDTLYFASNRFDSYASLFAARGRGTDFATPRAMALLETLAPTTAYENPIVSVDQRTIYFSAPPDLTRNARDIWIAMREDPAVAFELPQPVPTLNTTSNETPTWLSDDGCRLYFVTDRGGQGSRLWMASRRAP
jgi:hypothetical protein